MPRNFGIPARTSRKDPRGPSRLAKLAELRLRLSYAAGNAAQRLCERLKHGFAKRHRAPARQIPKRVISHIEADFIVFHAGEGMSSRVERLAQVRSEI